MPITLNGDGAISGLTATGISAVQNLPAGSVIQTVSATSTTAVSTSSVSFVTTNFSVSITPKFATSRIFISLGGGTLDTGAANQQVVLAIFKGGTNIASAAGLISCFSNSGRVISPSNLSVFDSPATTSLTTYTLFIAQNVGSGTVTFNSLTGTATLTAMEIAS